MTRTAIMSNTHTHARTHTYTQTHPDTHTHAHSHTDRHRHRHRQTQTHFQRRKTYLTALRTNEIQRIVGLAVDKVKKAFWAQGASTCERDNLRNYKFLCADCACILRFY